MKYFHVDVFAAEPLKGNGLTVVFPDKELTDSTMLEIAREFKQFETIFVYPKINNCYPVRIFTVQEELGFAGHPILGAAAVIHRLMKTGIQSLEINFILNKRRITVTSNAVKNHYITVMNQGKPAFLHTVIPENCPDIISALNISMSDLNKEYPVEVISTGLPYIFIPVKNCIERVCITVKNFEEIISVFGARFAYIFDPEIMECRTWDNSGLFEDAATGSAAGPLCAYLVKNKYRKTDEKINIFQGTYINRPSIITGWVSEVSKEVFVEGDVAFFGNGEILI